LAPDSPPDRTRNPSGPAAGGAEPTNGASSPKRHVFPGPRTRRGRCVLSATRGTRGRCVPRSDLPDPDVSASPLTPGDVADLPWQPPDRTGQLGDGLLEITGICYRRSDGAVTQCVERGDWIDLFVRYEARGDAGPINCGVEVHDRFDQLLFAVNWLNAELAPVHARAGDVFHSRFRLKADLEPGEYGLWLGAARALRDPQSHTGWDQHVGGERFVGLPRAGKVAVLPRGDRRRTSFGPANLRYRVDRSDPQPVSPPA
jgi:hypothetical protein